MGFVLNPYDPCVANKIINGKQCTIVWYVDDNKISHVDAQVVTQIIELIEQHFGKMTVTRGKKHVFLGMEICFNDDTFSGNTQKLPWYCISTRFHVGRTPANPPP